MQLIVVRKQLLPQEPVPWRVELCHVECLLGNHRFNHFNSTRLVSVANAKLLVFDCAISP